MSRVTKIAFWLIPWWPALVVAFMSVMYIKSREYTHTVFIPADGSPWQTELTPSELTLIAIARPVLFASFFPFIVGITLLVVAVVRRYRSKRSSVV
jgi:hypothetical protein